MLIVKVMLVKEVVGEREESMDGGRGKGKELRVSE